MPTRTIKLAAILLTFLAAIPYLVVHATIDDLAALYARFGADLPQPTRFVMDVHPWAPLLYGLGIIGCILLFLPNSENRQTLPFTLVLTHFALAFTWLGWVAFSAILPLLPLAG